jgi:hypothetical protein
MLDLSNAHHFRKTVAGVCMIAAPLMLLVGVVVHPEMSTEEARIVANAAASPDAWYISHLLLFGSVVLAVPAVLGLMHMLRERGTAYGHVGGGLAVLGLLCYAAVVGIEMVVWQMGAGGEMTALLTRVTETTGTVIPFMILPFAFGVGMVVLAMGLYRARAAVWMMAACLAVGGVAVTISGLVGETWFAIVAAAILLFGFAPIGQIVLSESDADWEHTPESPGYRPLAGTR